MEAKGNWTFTFLGADIDVFAESVKMGMSGTSGNTLSFNKSAAGYRGATVKMSNGNTRFYNNRTAGIRNVSDFYGGEDKEDVKKI